ncbi:hypothetical protein L210DRAFT_3588959 [Boletus edulis BED1]|uniref:Uncharacterized protein n=1 Tax=Boletus edulis BED1 TaxID=1328754 RepID=A0AAD4BAJ0_BOLED|nr:hypothetical protein L210DRAFT_3588959 [Boletus edulis BED1]
MLMALATMVSTCVSSIGTEGMAHHSTKFSKSYSMCILKNSTIRLLAPIVITLQPWGVVPLKNTDLDGDAAAKGSRFAEQALRIHNQSYRPVLRATVTASTILVVALLSSWHRRCRSVVVVAQG